MRVYGVDFTSAPGKRKPIVAAVGQLRRNTIHIEGLTKFTTLDAWANWLGHPGPWVMGCDFPFGLPRSFVAAVGWPQTWEACVRIAAGMTPEAYAAAIAAFRHAQPPGRKHPRRASDQRAGACSPLMLYGVPVAKMFYAGAPCLLQAPVHIPPCRPAPNVSRTVLEVYPGIVARTLVGNTPYKGAGKRSTETQRRFARAQIIAALQESGGAPYHTRLILPPALNNALKDDPLGDMLDALLCLLPTAWAVRHGEAKFGIPESADPLEGWLLDPATCMDQADHR